MFSEKPFLDICPWVFNTTYLGSNNKGKLLGIFNIIELDLENSEQK